MKKTTCKPGMPDCFPDIAGTAVVGERGQIVIPKEARDAARLSAGSKLIVLSHPKGGILLFPAEQMRDALDTMSKRFESIRKSL